MFEEETENIVRYIKFISDFIRSGIDDSVFGGYLIPVEHGFCFYCDTEKPVYDISPEFPPQPPTCDECLYQRSILAFSDPDKVREIVNHLKHR